jgi:hypothetical protein
VRSRSPGIGAITDLLHETWNPPPERLACPGIPVQEIASSNYPPVLVFVHLIKLAFTVGIESSFQVVEIRNQ